MKDFSGCQCKESGWCDLYKKEMTSSPPNWQWCQSASEDERKEYFSKSKKKINLSKKYVEVVEFYDALKKPNSEYAICVIPANEHSSQFLNHSRPSIQAYANKCKADYIELCGDQQPEWPISNKYRVNAVAKLYKKTLYLDCDIIIKENAPNIFDITPDDKISLCSDWDIFYKYNKTKWIQQEQLMIVRELLNNQHNINSNNFIARDMLSCGVMVIPNSLADFYKQPENRYPRQWCFDQHYLTLTTPSDKINILPEAFNHRTVTPSVRNEYNISSEFWDKLEDAYFIHVNGLNKDRYTKKLRLDLIERFSKNDFRKNKNTQSIKPGTFITNERLISDTLSIVQDLPPLKGILGVPRSGMFPASILSIATSLPLYSLSNGEIVLLSADEKYGGSRMVNFSQLDEDLPILVVDDTTYSGGAMFRTRLLMNEKFKNHKFLYTSIYHEPSSAYHLFKDSVSSDYLLDIINYELHFPHVLEWNFFNAHPMQLGMFDLDGVFCEDCPPEYDIDDKKYTNWIKNVQPYKIRIPKLFPCMAICTGRPEKFRSETEEWLDRHGIKYGKLFMWEGTKEQRDKNGKHIENVAAFKQHKFETYIDEIKTIHSHADIRYRSEPVFFVESCPIQSRIIAKTQKPNKWVISINERLTINGNNDK